MVATKQKPVVDTQKIKRRNLNIPLKKIIKPQRKKAREEERNKGTTKEKKNKQKPINQTSIVSVCLPIIILNVNELNSPIKIHTVDKWIKKRHNHMPRRDTLAFKAHIK